MTNQRNETPEPLAQEQAGEMEHGGELGMVESHPNFVAGFKAGHAAGRKRATAALQAKDAEIAGLKADAGRLEFMCSKAHLRFIEGNDDMWRVYQDEAAPEACAHKWRAIVSMYHPTSREAIDAAIRAQTGGDHESA